MTAISTTSARRPCDPRRMPSPRSRRRGTGRSQEGAVGAGTGTIAFGWKGGIGTSSRRLPAPLGGWTVGVLVQTNYGGVLDVAGVPVGRALGRYYAARRAAGARPATAR